MGSPIEQNYVLVSCYKHSYTVFSKKIDLLIVPTAAFRRVPDDGLTMRLPARRQNAVALRQAEKTLKL
jgi:hypothetical protein